MKRYRYYEVTDGERFRAVIPTEPVDSREGDELAILDAAEAWDADPSTIEVFVHRALTPEKHDVLTRAALNGTLDPDWWCAGNRSHRAGSTRVVEVAV